MVTNLLLVLSILALLLLYLRAHRVEVRQTAELTALKADAARSEAAGAEWRDRAEEAERQIRELVGERAALLAKLDGAEQKLREEIARHDREKADRVQDEETLRAQFRNLANDILGEQSRRFQQSSRESIDALLNPFVRTSMISASGWRRSTPPRPSSTAP